MTLFLNLKVCCCFSVYFLFHHIFSYYLLMPSITKEKHEFMLTIISEKNLAFNTNDQTQGTLRAARTRLHKLFINILPLSILLNIKICISKENYSIGLFIVYFILYNWAWFWRNRLEVLEPSFLFFYLFYRSTDRS